VRKRPTRGGCPEIFDGAVNGNEVFWKVSITDPIPMTLDFAGTVNGNEISPPTHPLGRRGSPQPLLLADCLARKYANRGKDLTVNYVTRLRIDNTRVVR
jgi:hypothetical protein